MLTTDTMSTKFRSSLFALLFLIFAFGLAACGEPAEVGSDKKCMAEDNPLIDCRISRCDDGEVCAPDESLCRPSSCFCDATTGGWVCTDDCGPGYSCQAPSSCEGPDPSIDCSTTGCPGDMECVVDADADECLSSSCFCDEETGIWACADDCRASYVCVPPAGACEGDDPSVTCRTMGCPSGQTCVEDALGCTPSACSCDAATGQWLCTADCGPSFICQDPNAPTCEGPDPSLDCRDTGCNDDEDCIVEVGACLPSSCSCEAEGWICTEDCGERYSCTPKSGEVCDTPDPSQDCRDTGCEGVQECLPADGCRSSSCYCSDGNWFCTRDCHELYACQDPAGPVCEGTNPSHDCTWAERCPAGSSCLPSNLDVCRPSGCSCTEEGWTCTDDCNTYYECVVNRCEGPNPSIDCRRTGCSDDGQTCQPDRGCRPSSCDCIGDSWLCTQDCQDLYTCQDEGGPVCEGPDPSIDCSTTGCDEGLECVVSPLTVCRPSACECTTEGWICTKDCQPTHVCERVLACEGPNPAGCTQEGCDDGFECIIRSIDTECAPSECHCTNGQWLCTTDCGGGGVCTATI